MQQGDSGKLLVEELITLLKELGNLFSAALDAQDSSENTDVMISLAWYQYYLNGVRTDLAMAASTVENVGRSSALFEKLAEPSLIPKRHVTLHDLKEKHDKFRLSHDTTRLAYSDFINSQSFVKVILNAGDQQLRSAGANLKQALTAL